MVPDGTSQVPLIDGVTYTIVSPDLRGQFLAKHAVWRDGMALKLNDRRNRDKYFPEIDLLGAVRRRIESQKFVRCLPRLLFHGLRRRRLGNA
jgi:hypothetical protein